MAEARMLIGDVFDQIATIPDASVDLICTSPPFWMQRAYLPADHPDKPREIGQEPTPADYIDVLLRLTAEFRRVLAPHGSIAVELGDTIANSGGAGGDYGLGGMREGQPKFAGSARADGAKVNRTRIAGAKPYLAADGPLAKSHCMIPEAYRLALAYGHNPLSGNPSPAGRWIVRNAVDWCRLNPTPGDDGDKFRRASSDIVIATLNPRRWWDGEAVREPATGRPGGGTGKRKGQDGPAREAGNGRVDSMPFRESDDTRPLFDWWALASEPYSGAHYAVWPPEVARRLILAMCPQRVCTVCGEPSRRIVDVGYMPLRDIATQNAEHKASADYPGQQRAQNAQGMAHGRATRESRTLGWTNCECCHDDNCSEHWRLGHVLDPFGGSGTTAAVATGNGRDCTLIDLDARNVELAQGRVGMFLETPAP